MDTLKKKVLQCLLETKGIVTSACYNANIARSTFYDWLKNDEEFKIAVDDVNETAIDFVESKLLERINGNFENAPSDTAIIFFLKTRGKKRGYIERVEVDNITPIQLISLDPLSDATPADNSTTEDSGS